MSDESGQADHLVGIEAVSRPEPNPGDPGRLRVELVGVFGSGARISTAEVGGGFFVSRDVVGSGRSATARSEDLAELEAHIRRSIAGDLIPREWHFRLLIDALATHGIITSPEELAELPLRIDLRLG